MQVPKPTMDEEEAVEGEYIQTSASENWTPRRQSGLVDK